MVTETLICSHEDCTMQLCSICAAANMNGLLHKDFARAIEEGMVRPETALNQAHLTEDWDWGNQTPVD